MLEAEKLIVTYYYQKLLGVYTLLNYIAYHLTY